MSDVFISYSRADRPRVLPLAEALKELGLDIWFDAALHNGSDFSSEINEELRTAKTILVCWSEKAVASHWVKAEAQIGLEHNKLAACFLEACPLWPPFNIVQTDDLKAWSGDWAHSGFQSLVERVGSLVGRPGLRDLCVAQADPTGSRLASWASTFPDDPAAASAWPIWERRQREDFHRSVAEVKQAIVEQSRLRLKKTAAKLSSIERDFEAWVARGSNAVKHRRPDPAAILRSQADEDPGAATRAAGLGKRSFSRRGRATFAASVAAAMVAGSGVAWLVFKATSPADAGIGDGRAQIAQLETKLTAAAEQAAADRRVLTDRFGKAKGDADASRDRVASLEKTLKTTDLSAARARQDLQSAETERDEARAALKEMLETQAQAAVKSFYRLHEFDKSRTTPGAVVEALGAIYPERFEKKGQSITREKHVGDLRDFYAKVDKVSFELFDRKFDYTGCTSQHSCRVKGYGQTTWVQNGQVNEGRLSFSLLFDLGQPAKVLSECANLAVCD